MKKRNLVKTLLAVAVAFAPLAVCAQPPAGEIGFDGDWGPDRMERGQGQRIEMMIEFLELSDAQTVEIESILAEQSETRRAASETLRADGEELRTLLESDSPNATLVGQRVLAIHAARKAMREQGGADLERIRGVLTPDQIDKFDALMAVRELGRGRGERGRRGRRGLRGADQPTDG